MTDDASSPRRLIAIVAVAALVLVLGGIGIAWSVIAQQGGDVADSPATSTPDAGSSRDSPAPPSTAPSARPQPTVAPTPLATPGPDPSTGDRSDAGGSAGTEGADTSDRDHATPGTPDDPTPTPTSTPTPPPGPDSPVLPPGSTRSIYDASGNIRMPMPQLAGEPSVVRNDDGTATVTVRFGFDVANRETRAGVRQDQAIVHVMVSDRLGAGGGPLRSMTPLYSQTLIESDLDHAHVERDYTVKLPGEVVAFLDTKGFASPEPAIRRAALVYVDLDVQQMRDFKVVDGEWDWQQGGAWTAADLPVRVATTRSSTMTMTNSTGDGVYRTDITQFPNVQAAIAAGFIDVVDLEASDRVIAVAPSLIEQTDAYAAPISLSGQSVQCIAQGNGSNPQGFALMNGWDIEDALPPGTIPDGASVTQTVVADDSIGAPTPDIIDDTGTATVQTTAAALSYTTPGVKSAAQYTYMLALGLTSVSDAATVALGVPIKAIVELGHAIYDAATDSCADFANIVNITAVEPSGAMSSVSWANQKDGLFQVYESATNDGTPVNDAVQLAKSTGTVTGVVDGVPYAANPYLTQYPQTACGNSSSCENNEIEVQWSANSPCPQNDQADCLPQASDVASPQLDVPGTSLCGVDNELCPTIAAPISSASDVPAETDLAGTVGNPYAVMSESNPSTAITAMAVDTAGRVYLGNGTGVVNILGASAGAPQIDGFAGGVTAMAAVGDVISIADETGALWAYDPATGVLTLVGAVAEGSSISHIVSTGDGTAYYTTTDGLLYYLPAFDPDDPLIGAGNLMAKSQAWGDFDGNLANQPITSVASDDSVLFLGFGSGYVMKCTLTDCNSSLELWVNPFSLPDYEENGDLSTFSAQALQIVGDELYLGGSDASLWQIGVDDGSVEAIQTVGQESAQIAGLAVADGALYVGGCFGIESPITSHMLGVFTLSAIDGVDSTYGLPAGPNEALPYSCQNPSSTTSHFKGFDPSTYQLVVSKPDPNLPAIVYVSFTINTGNFLYALQNTSLPTTGICSSDCPPDTQLSYYDTDTTTQPFPASGSLRELGAPDVKNSCGTTSGYGSTDTGDLLTSSGVVLSDGFQLVAAGSATQACTSQYTWTLGDVGTFPYAYWSGTAYPDSVSAAGAAVSLTAAGGWDTGSITEAVPGTGDSASLKVFAPKYLTTTAAQLPTPYDFPLVTGVSAAGDPELAAPPLTPVDEQGSALLLPVTDEGLLVLTVEVPAGSDPLVIDVADDLLTRPGDNPPTPPSADLCPPFDLSLTGDDALLYPLDDSGYVAADITGNGYNGIITAPGTRDVTPGPAAACPDAGGLTFTGRTSVDAGRQASALAGGSALTVMAWFQLSGDDVAGNPRLLANDHTDETGVGFQLAFTGGADGVSRGFFDVGTAAGIGTVSWSVEQPVSMNAWHQYVGVYDGTTLTAYLDGKAVGSSQPPIVNEGATQPPATGTTGPILPGGSDVAVGFDPAYDADYFSGLMADVMVSGSALTAQEVASIYSQTTTGSP